MGCPAGQCFPSRESHTSFSAGSTRIDPPILIAELRVRLGVSEANHAMLFLICRDTILACAAQVGSEFFATTPSVTSSSIGLNVLHYFSSCGLL